MTHSIQVRLNISLMFIYGLWLWRLKPRSDLLLEETGEPRDNHRPAARP